MILLTTTYNPQPNKIMTLTLSNLKPAKGAIKKRKDIGRGGKRGTYSGRGLKGQKARSGGTAGLKALGMRQVIRRIPKLRGFKSHKPKMAIVNLADLEKTFENGAKVNPQELFKAGLIRGSAFGVKILGEGKLSKKLNVSAKAFSASAKEAIEKAGGQIEIK